MIHFLLFKSADISQNGKRYAQNWILIIPITSCGFTSYFWNGFCKKKQNYVLVFFALFPRSVTSVRRESCFFLEECRSTVRGQKWSKVPIILARKKVLFFCDENRFFKTRTQTEIIILAIVHALKCPLNSKSGGRILCAFSEM